MPSRCLQCRRPIPPVGVLQRETQFEYECRLCGARHHIQRAWHNRRRFSWAFLGLTTGMAVVAWLVFLALEYLVKFRTTNGTEFRIVLIPLVIMVAVIPLWLLRRDTITLIEPGTLCYACGYNLIGLPHRRCPECGHINPEITVIRK